jgi:hypothetical protein
MRRAALAGVETIEHGGEGTPDLQADGRASRRAVPHHYGRWALAPGNPDSPAAQRKPPASKPRSTPA